MKKGWLLVGLGFMMCTVTIYGEEEDFVIHVVDEQQESLEGVSLEVVNDGNHHSRTYESDKRGNVAISNMKIGNYTITVDSKDSYDLKTSVDVNVTPYTIKNKTKLTVVLKKSFHKDTRKDYAIVFLLIAILNMIFYYGILIFQKKTFTQFLDDIML
ncbi:MAG: carboxypeptidase-like regulatory domain-containing protein [Longicatena sp.]